MSKLLLTFAFSAVLALTSPSASSKDQFGFRSQIETGELPTRGGLVHCELLVVPFSDLAEITIKLSKADSLEYMGPDHFTCSGKAWDTCKHSFDVMIPDSVLSGVEFEVSSGKVKMVCRRYFAPVDNTVLTFTDNPRTSPAFRDPYLPEKKQKVYTPEDHEGVYTGPTVTRIPGEKKPVFNDLTRAQHRPGYYSAPTISKIKDTTGLVQFAGADYDPADSSMMMLLRGDTVVARMPKELFFKHYGPMPQTKVEEKQTKATQENGESAPR